MHKKLTKRKHKSKKEKSCMRHGLYLSAYAKYQAMPCMTKLIANKQQFLLAANDANYYETTQMEVLHALA